MERFRQSLKVQRERAILVGAILKRGQVGDDLAELSALVESADAQVVDRFQQRLNSILPATYIGKGKAEELAERVIQFEADVVIFDNNLSPGQIRELERIIKVKVLDRSELILDIFATRAQTRQARLQVELAQLQYTYPRLTRMWSHLDTIAGAGGGSGAGSVGGIGTRGPGEKQLEIDRRLVNKRISELKNELKEIDKRKLREINGRRDLYKVGLVGYTNSGKSTLLNALTSSDVYVKDQLFATLDTRTRKWCPERGLEVLLSDTVGFVRNLPHQLVASFKATLEEAVHADLLLHVVDVSNSEVLEQVEAVNQVLKEIGCNRKPTIMVLNKTDMISTTGPLDLLQTLHPDSVTISAKTRMGLTTLSEVICDRFRGRELHLKVRCSQADGKIQSFLRAQGQILEETYQEEGVCVEVVLGRSQLPGLKQMNPQEIEFVS